MSSVTVNHSDLSTTVYPNYFAGISSNPGDGWVLCLIPDLSITGGPTKVLIVPLLSGDTYQTTGSLPAQSFYPNYANLMSRGVLPVGTSKQVTFTPPASPVSVGPVLSHSVKITHSDGTVDTYPNMMCGISNKQAQDWFLSLINGDPTLDDAKRRKAASFVIPLRKGDRYETTGTLPPAWIYANPQIVWHTVLPIGTAITPP